MEPVYRQLPIKLLEYHKIVKYLRMILKIDDIDYACILGKKIRDYILSINPEFDLNNIEYVYLLTETCYLYIDNKYMNNMHEP